MTEHVLESDVEGTLFCSQYYWYRCAPLVAFMVLLLYDHAITFHLEVERIWTLEWRLPKYLFLINRYIAPVIILSFNIAMAAYPGPLTSILIIFPDSDPKRSRLYAYPYFWLRILPLLTAGLVLVIRVSALYGHNKTMLRCLISLWIFQGISVIASLGALKREFRGGSTSGMKFDILLNDTNVLITFKRFLDISEAWIPYVIFDGIVIILTMYQVFSYRKRMNPTVRLLARDSIAYFIIMFGTFLFNLFGTIIPGVAISLPAEYIACIAVARMMMNIRGLVFDDPYSSQEMELSTIEFRGVAEASVHSENR